MIQIDETPKLAILLFNVKYRYIDQSTDESCDSSLEFYYFPDSDSTCISENIMGGKNALFYRNAVDLSSYYDKNEEEDVINDVKRRIEEIIKKKNSMDWKSIGKSLKASYV